MKPIYCRAGVLTIVRGLGFSFCRVGKVWELKWCGLPVAASQGE